MKVHDVQQKSLVEQAISVQTATLKKRLLG
jgi:hypothetical protein